MRNSVIVIVVILACMAIAKAQDFGCQLENSTVVDINETGERLYTMHYVNCTQRPRFIEETVYYNVTNCTATDFIKYLDNYTNTVEAAINCTGKLIDVTTSRDMYKTQLDASDVKVKEKETYITDSCVDKDVATVQYNAVVHNATTCQEGLSKETFMGYVKFGVGLLVGGGGIWYFSVRRPTASKSDVTPATGEIGYDSHAIDMDTKIAQLNSNYRSELEKMRSEINRLQRAPKKSTKDTTTDEETSADFEVEK